MNERATLSEREIEILRLVATGATNQEIAQQLIISVNTVKVHLRNIYEKLGVASRTEATMFAVRQGWVHVPEQGSPAVARTPVEVTAELAAAASVGLLGPECGLHVSPVKQLSLAVVLVLAVASFFFPSVPRGRGNGAPANPIEGVFPASLPPLSTNRWHTRAQLPTPRAHLAVAAHGDLIYAIGGVSNNGVVGKVEIYDPRQDSWSTGHAKPTPVGFVSAGVAGNKIYLPGGLGIDRQVQNVLEIYDPVADRWERGAPMPEGLALYGLATFQDKIYLFGGWNGREYVASVSRYDPETDRWETLEPMDQARGFLGAAALGDRIYVAGGFDDVREYNRLDSYDPATGTWTRRAPMAVRRGGLAVIAVRDYLYAVGGTMTGYLAFNERYDPRTDAWTRIETPVQEQWVGLGLAFSRPNIYAIGGWNGGSLSANESYQPLFQVPVPVSP